MIGTPLDPGNLSRRVLAPPPRRPTWRGAARTGSDTPRVAAFDGGRNVVQVQRWLGHHKPSFTLDTYVHLLCSVPPGTSWRWINRPTLQQLVEGQAPAPR